MAHRTSAPFSVEAIPQLSPAELREEVLALCSLGATRFVGSPGEGAARAYLVRALTEAGLVDVRCEEFRTLVYEAGPSACELSNGFSTPTTGMQFTASGRSEGEAIYLGRPSSPADIMQLRSYGADVSGRIAILDTYYPYVFADALVESGAIGYVAISNAPDGLLGNYVGQFYPKPEDPSQAGSVLGIPGVVIERDAGQTLLALLSAGVHSLRIQHGGSHHVTATANVVGELPGAESEEKVVLGAHYDTQLADPGYSDNATGVATVVSLARRWRRLRLRRTLVLCAFAGEEIGMVGSSAYCRQHRDHLTHTVGMVNLDALGWAPYVKRSLYADPSLHEYAKRCAAEFGWAPDEELDASTFAGSDHNPFIDAGVPACWFWRYPPGHPYYHTAGDTLELLDFDTIAETANVSAFVAARLADDGDLPFSRSTPTRRWQRFDTDKSSGHE